MSGVRTIEVLRTARKLVANPKTWTKDTMAEDASGCSVGVRSGSATRFCAMGAISWSAFHMGVETWADIQPLEDVLDRISQRFWRDASCFMAVNDDWGRGAALRVIDAAIAELEGQ